MKSSLMLGLLIVPLSILSTVAAPTTQPLRVQGILDYQDNIPKQRAELRKFMGSLLFHFAIDKTMQMQDQRNNTTCRWDDRPSRPIGTVNNVSFTCDRADVYDVSGVLDTDHNIMLMHVNITNDESARMTADARLLLAQP